MLVNGYFLSLSLWKRKIHRTRRKGPDSVHRNVDLVSKTCRSGRVSPPLAYLILVLSHCETKFLRVEHESDTNIFERTSISVLKCIALKNMQPCQGNRKAFVTCSLTQTQINKLNVPVLSTPGIYLLLTPPWYKTPDSSTSLTISYSAPIVPHASLTCHLAKAIQILEPPCVHGLNTSCSGFQE